MTSSQPQLSTHHEPLHHARFLLFLGSSSESKTNRHIKFKVGAGIDCAAGYITIAELAFVPSEAMFKQIVDSWLHDQALEEKRAEESKRWAPSKLPFGSTTGPIPVR